METETPPPCPKPSTSKSKSRSERDTKCTECPPNREVKLYEWSESQYKEIKVPLRQTSSATHYSESFQTVDNKRQASRNDFNKSLRKLAIKVKNVTNDDLFMAIKKSEKVKENEDPVARFTTDPEFKFVKEEELTSPPQPSTPGPSPLSSTRLLLVSPSTRVNRPKRVSTARGSSQSKYCEVCKHKYRPTDNVSDPWVGCFAWSDKKTPVRQRCEVWVHSSCTGWMAKNTEEVGTMPDWYCQRHRGTFMVPRSSKKKGSKSKSKSRKQ